MASVVNLCVEQGVFPDSLKKYRVVPVHKGGDNLIRGNWRPIAISSPLGKILGGNI